MTPIYDKVIDGPSAWTPASTGGKEGLVKIFSARHLEAIDSLLRNTRGIDMENIRQTDFRRCRSCDAVSDGNSGTR